MKGDMLDRWRKLWGRLGSTKNMAPLFHKLCQAYGEQQRAYHDFSHIRRCLDEFECVKDRLGHPDEVELAIWFHDIIYDPISSTNEEDSAEYATLEMKNAAIGEDSTRMVADFILATRHNGAVNGPDARYLVDIDIATLGSAPEIYRKYENDIRKEHKWVPESIYREKRKERLMSFLINDQIYHTDFFRSKYGQMAKMNLEAALRGLYGDG